MPQLGEIQRAKDIGYKGTGRYIWHSCEGCGEERWVQVWDGIPTHKICKACKAMAVGERQRGVTKARGAGYINLCLAILKQAKQDKHKMWLGFQKTDIYKIGVKGNVVSLNVAWWVSNFIS